MLVRGDREPGDGFSHTLCRETEAMSDQRFSVQVLVSRTGKYLGTAALRRITGNEPVGPVVWEGRRRESPAYPIFNSFLGYIRWIDMRFSLMQGIFSQRPVLCALARAIAVT